MTTATESRVQIEAAIEKELDRLDSYNDGQGIVCQAGNDLPLGWTRVYDNTCEVYGPAADILAALKNVQYDADEVVRVEEHPIQVSETECEVLKEEVTARADSKGFELAWAALARFSEDAPRNAISEE